MQSSFVVMLRSLIMLACMITLPVIAVFGTSWGKQLQELLGQATRPIQSSPLALRVDPPASGPTGPAPPFPGPAAPVESSPVELQAAPSSTLPPSTASSWPGDPTHNAPANYLAPASADDSWGRVGATPAVQPVASTTVPAMIPSASAASPLPGMVPSASPGTGTDSFREIQNQLRSLGATYILLETWGQRGDLYRFQCKVALHDNPHFTRHFEATDADPLAAMQRVLADVANWKQPTYR